jgi:hypothetical protein
MGEARSTHGEMKNAAGLLLESLKGRDHVKVVGVNEMDLAEMVWEGVD